MLNFFLFITALVPVMIFIGLGIFLRYIKFLPETGWEALERVIYYILFPALLLHAISNINYDVASFVPMIAALNIATLSMFLLSFLAWYSKGCNGPNFTSIIQNNIRFNSFVALMIASQYNGGYFLPLVAVGVATLIPTVNILSIWSLIIWGKASKDESPVLSLLTNPLIIACAIGFLLFTFNIKLPNIAKDTLDTLGTAAMPLALIAVGTGIDFEQFKNKIYERYFWALFRNLIFPITSLISCYLFGIKDMNIIVATVIISAAPTATNGYILARQMGGDAPFMANLIGTSTIISVITFPLVIYIILNSGILNVIF